MVVRLMLRCGCGALTYWPLPEVCGDITRPNPNLSPPLQALRLDLDAGGLPAL